MVMSSQCGDQAAILPIPNSNGLVVGTRQDPVKALIPATSLRSEVERTREARGGRQQFGHLIQVSNSNTRCYDHTIHTIEVTYSTLANCPMLLPDQTLPDKTAILFRLCSDQSRIL